MMSPCVIEPRGKKALNWPGAKHPVKRVRQWGIKPSDFLRMALAQSRAEARVRLLMKTLAMDWAANANAAAIGNAPADNANTRGTSGFDAPDSFGNTPSQTSIYGCHLPSPPPKWDLSRADSDRGTNWNFFWDWALGQGSNNRYYGPNTIETQQLRNSIGVKKLRERFKMGGCKNISRGAYGTYEAYWDTILNPFTADWSNTAAQVGGFARARVTNNGDGTTTFTITNVAGTRSFFYHLIPDRESTTGPMRSITQTFQWTEPIDCR